MEKLKKTLGAFLVPLLSILMAFIIGGIIMAALGADEDPERPAARPEAAPAAG